MKEFDILNCSLRGQQLIEASAGTGKTFTITRIFLRLLLEGYTIFEIILVSFTIAATRELRERIRRVLEEALELIENPIEKPIEGSGLRQILEAYPKDKTETAIREALANFDQINVCTIHSFCRQILEEQTFSSGIFPNTSINLEDEKKLKREIVLDFWRREVQGAPRLFLEFLLSIDFRAEQWCLSFQEAPSSQDWLLASEAKRVIKRKDLEKYCKEAEDAFLTFQRVSFRKEEEVLEFFTFLKKRSGCQKGTVDKVIEAIQEHAQKSRLHFLPWDIEEKIFKLYQEKKELSESFPNSSFRKEWESYRQKYEALVYALRDHLFFCFSSLQENYKKVLEEKKEAKAIVSYEDLLLKTYRALAEPRKGQAILDSLWNKKKYRVALIDEFQDTDRLQAKIFSKIFSEPSHSLFLIGDPKQSIYAFRGSDIESYKEWKDKVKRKYSLAKNYRSSPLLLEGIHALYTSHESFPFADPALTYYPTQAAKRKNEKGEEKGSPSLIFSGPSSPKKNPLQIVLSRERKIKEKPSINESREEIQEWIALEIQRLLLLAERQQLFYEKRAPLVPLEAKDIAILVRRGREGIAIRNILQEYGISAALRIDENVFGSEEALDLELILTAIIERGRGNKLKAALATRLWGYDAAAIDSLFQTEEKKAAFLQSIKNYAEELGKTRLSVHVLPVALWGKNTL